MQYLRDQHAKGLIRGFTEPVKTVNQTPQSKIVAKHFAKRSKEKDWISWNLLMWANNHAVQLHEEFKFSEERGFKSDWAIPAFKLLIEYEGGVFKANGDHNSARGIHRDIEKYGLAQRLGFRVIRLTVGNYKNMLTELNKYL